MSEREALSPQQLRTARFKIIRNMLKDDPELAETVRKYMGWIPTVDNIQFFRLPDDLNILRSKAASTGHTIMLTSQPERAPICPTHKKRAIICEPPDEAGLQRWFCIDCVLEAIYEGNRKVRKK